MITHGAPAAPDAGPNLLKISESAFCVGLREAARDRPAAFVWRRLRTPRLKSNANRRTISEKLGEQIRERKTNRCVAPVLRGLLGIKRQSLIFKGLKEHRTQPEIFGKERRRTARNPLFAGLSGGSLGEIRAPDPRIRSPMLCKNS
jgi:hypothetical protein